MKALRQPLITSQDLTHEDCLMKALRRAQSSHDALAATIVDITLDLQPVHYEA